MATRGNHRNTFSNHLRIREGRSVSSSSNPASKQCTKCSEQRNRELAEVLGRLGMTVNQYKREFGLF